MSDLTASGHRVYRNCYGDPSINIRSVCFSFFVQSRSVARCLFLALYYYHSYGMPYFFLIFVTFPCYIGVLKWPVPHVGTEIFSYCYDLKEEVCCRQRFNCLTNHCSLGTQSTRQLLVAVSDWLRFPEERSVQPDFWILIFVSLAVVQLDFDNGINWLQTIMCTWFPIFYVSSWAVCATHYFDECV